MRTVVLGLLAGLLLSVPLAGLLAVKPIAYAQIPGIPNRQFQTTTTSPSQSQLKTAKSGATAQVSATPNLIVTTTIIEGTQQLTLIDPNTRVISIYHVSSDGRLTLKCVRDAQWDMKIDDYNGASPSPREIRALILPR